MDHLKADWNGISRKSNSVFLVELDGPNGYREIDKNKSDFDGINTYVEYGVNYIYLYKIKDKVLDSNNNLILFVEKVIHDLV